jgi:uncharacterized membrane protein
LRTFDGPAGTLLLPFDLNNRGQIVGEYQDADGVFHGYLWERGRFRTLPTGAAIGINNRGQLVGIALNPEDLPGPPATDPAPMGRMA